MQYVGVDDCRQNLLDVYAGQALRTPRRPARWVGPEPSENAPTVFATNGVCTTGGHDRYTLGEPAVSGQKRRLK